MLFPEEERVPRLVRARRLHRRRVRRWRPTGTAAASALRRRDRRAQAAAGASPLARAPWSRAGADEPRAASRGRFAAGSLAGAAFVPLGAALRARWPAAATAERSERSGAHRYRACLGPAGRRAVALLAPAHVIGTTLSDPRALRDRGDDAGAAGPARRPAVLRWSRRCVNVFIVGVNQLTDVEIDRINKPFLPIAAGDLCFARRAGSSRVHA